MAGRILFADTSNPILLVDFLPDGTIAVIPVVEAYLVWTELIVLGLDEEHDIFNKKYNFITEVSGKQVSD